MGVVVVRMHLEGLLVRRLGLVEASKAQVYRREIHLRFEEMGVEAGRSLKLFDRSIDLPELVEDEPRGVVDRRVVGVSCEWLASTERREPPNCCTSPRLASAALVAMVRPIFRPPAAPGAFFFALPK